MSLAEFVFTVFRYTVISWCSDSVARSTCPCCLMNQKSPNGKSIKSINLCTKANYAKMFPFSMHIQKSAPTFTSKEQDIDLPFVNSTLQLFNSHPQPLPWLLWEGVLGLQRCFGWEVYVKISSTWMPAEHSIVTRWSMLFTSTFSLLNLKGDGWIWLSNISDIAAVLISLCTVKCCQRLWINQMLVKVLLIKRKRKLRCVQGMWCRGILRSHYGKQIFWLVLYTVIRTVFVTSSKVKQS